MNPAYSEEGESVQAESTWTPGQLQDAGRGYLHLAWLLPLLTALFYAVFTLNLSLRQFVAPYALVFLMIFRCLRRTRPPSSESGISSVFLCGLGVALLTPFLFFWRAAPTSLFFAINVLCHLVLSAVWLVTMHLHVLALASDFHERYFQNEVRRNLFFVLAPIGLYAGIFLYMAHRDGLWDCETAVVLFHAVVLLKEGFVFLMIPYWITAFLLWHASGVAFRRALYSPPPTEPPLRNNSRA